MSDSSWQMAFAKQATAADPAAPGISPALELGVIRCQGQDAVSFLQGYLTCDMDRLPNHQWQATALCNLKGRVVANGWVCQVSDDQVCWLIHRSLVAKTLEFLAKYIVFAKAELTSGNLDSLVLAGYQTPAPAGIRALPLQQQLWLAVITEPQAAQLTAAATPLTHPGQFAWQCIQHHWALVDEQASDNYLPQMLGLAQSGAVDFSKGCYLGQEIVARAQHRGSVKRLLAQLTWTQEQSDPVSSVDGHRGSDELTNHNGKTVGQVVMSIATPTGRSGLALAVLNGEPIGTYSNAQQHRRYQPAVAQAGSEN